VFTKGVWKTTWTYGWQEELEKALRPLQEISAN
jgi:hypothetical protein